MKRGLSLLIILQIGIILVWPRLCPAQVDSLVDCFPLSIGNQWSYWYFINHPRYFFRMQGWESYKSKCSLYW